MDWAEYKALWQEIDRRFGAGEYTSEEAVEAAHQPELEEKIRLAEIKLERAKANIESPKRD